MATFSASATLSFSSIRPPHQTPRFSSAKLVSLRSDVPTLRMTSNLQICCAAKQETMQKVCEIVKKQLAVPEGTEVTPESTFADLGADSLDTVEIVMELETAFGITVEEDNAQNIATVQNAADLIEELMDGEPEAALKQTEQ